MSNLEYQQVLSLTLEQLSKYLKSNSSQLHYSGLLTDLISLAKEQRLISTGSSSTVIFSTSSGQLSPQEARLQEPVRQALWECFRRGLVVFGINADNPVWPWFTFTEMGRQALAFVPPQPYDPDGFLRYFRASVVSIDPVVDEYVIEAVQDFNSGSYRSAAVMLGCASEQLILLLCEAFGRAITDSLKRAQYEHDTANWMIYAKYRALKERLDLMATAKRLPRDHIETINSELPSGFELLRRCRNSAGHPNVQGDVMGDTIFMNLRAFIEYARRVTELIKYFDTIEADWP